jgi:hypothetical protein
MSAAGGEVGVADKRWWGPRIWRILHCLAEISDRRDCGGGWRVVLQETTQMLPCDMCREHFQVAVRGLRIPGPAGSQTPRDAVRRMLWATHAGTGGGLPEAGLSAEYGYGGDRGAVVTEVRRLVEEICSLFRAGNVLDRFRAVHLEPWARAVRQLAALLATPEIVAVVGGRRRR